jgi:hypothetical protein
MTRRKAVKVFTKLPFYFPPYPPLPTSALLEHIPWNLMSISERHATESTGRKARAHMVGRLEHPEVVVDIGGAKHGISSSIVETGYH